MSSPTLTIQAPGTARLRSLIWPREHGAWGMLLVPLATGAALGRPVGDRVVLVFLLTLAALGLFCARTPIEARLGISPWRAQSPREQRAINNSIYIYASVSLGPLAILLWRIRSSGLLWVGAAAAIAFLGQVILRSGGRRTRMASQLVGSIGLTATAAAAYYVASGRLDTIAFVIWAANWVFAANQILYVQARIHSARATTFNERLSQGRWLVLNEILMALALTLSWRRGWLPSMAVLSFVPVLWRGLPWFFASASRLQIRRLGISELLHAALFAVLFIVGFQLTG